MRHTRTLQLLVSIALVSAGSVAGFSVSESRQKGRETPALTRSDPVRSLADLRRDNDAIGDVRRAGARQLTGGLIGGAELLDQTETESPADIMAGSCCCTQTGSCHQTFGSCWSGETPTDCPCPTGGCLVTPQP